MPDLHVYGRSTCQESRDTLRKAEQLGLACRYVDLDQDTDAECRLTQEGHRTLPVVEMADMVWTGFCPDLPDQVAP